MSEPNDTAILMGYEAMRICLGLPTRITPPEEVILWMRCILNPTTPAQVLLTKEPQCEHDAAEYNPEHDNFYCIHCRKGMGIAFYKVAMENKQIEAENAAMRAALRQINDREFHERPRYGQTKTFTIAHDALNKIRASTTTPDSTGKVLLTKEEWEEAQKERTNENK